MKQTTLVKIAPKAERIVSLYAAAEFKATLAGILEDGTVKGANEAQAKINDAIEYHAEAHRLQVECRAICRENGDRLPGLKGLQSIADTVYA